MLIKLTHLLLFFTLVSFYGGSSSHEFGYPASPCLEYSMKESVTHLWDIPQNITPTIKEFEEALSSLVPDADDRLLGYLVSLSLWVVDHFTGMPTVTHPSCIYGRLLNQTLVNNLINESCAVEGLARARSNYGGLCINGIDNTIYVGMKMAGCKIKIPRQRSSRPCNIGSAPEMLLADATSEIPECLKPIMLKLASSTHPDDKAVAAAAFGASTRASIDFFQDVLREESFIKAVQLKGCKIKVRKDCCSQRKEELRYWVEILKEYTERVMNVEYKIYQ